MTRKDVIFASCQVLVVAVVAYAMAYFLDRDLGVSLPVWVFAAMGAMAIGVGLYVAAIYVKNRWRKR
jgi:hypothetical protein